jgi:hypothetical protein
LPNVALRENGKDKSGFFLFDKIGITYFILALVSLTATTKNNTVKGILKAKMTPVVMVPNSGLPDDNSNTEPTAAIAVIHEPNNNTPLFGVTIFTPDIYQFLILRV